MMKLKEFAKNLSLVCLGLLLGVVILELAMRPRVTIVPPFLRADATYGHKMREDWQGIHRSPGEFAVHYQTNSLGFRDDEIISPKPEGVCRIVGLGDSYTMGYGVEVEETFLNLLQEAFDAEAPDAVEVINTGVGGWGTAHQLKLLEQMGEDLQPDLILVGYVRNDAKDSLNSGLYRLLEDGRLESVPPDQRPEWTSPLRDTITGLPVFQFLGKNSALFNWIRLRLTYERKKVREEQSEAQIGSGQLAGPSPEADLQRQIILALAEAGDELGADVLYVKISSDDPSIDPMADMCRNQDIPCLALDEDVMEEASLQGGEVRYPIDGHWTPYGHELASKAIYEYLRLHEMPSCVREAAVN